MTFFHLLVIRWLAKPDYTVVQNVMTSSSIGESFCTIQLTMRLYTPFDLTRVISVNKIDSGYALRKQKNTSSLREKQSSDLKSGCHKSQNHKIACGHSYDFVTDCLHRTMSRNQLQRSRERRTNKRRVPGLIQKFTSYNPLFVIDRHSFLTYNHTQSVLFL